MDCQEAVRKYCPSRYWKKLEITPEPSSMTSVSSKKSRDWLPFAEYALWGLAITAVIVLLGFMIYLIVDNHPPRKQAIPEDIIPPSPEPTKFQPEHIYIKNNTNYCMTKQFGHDENGSPIRLWECSHHPESSEWMYDAVDGLIRLKSNPSKCVEIQDGVAVLSDCNTAAAKQGFVYDPTNFHFRWNQDPRMCLGSIQSSRQNGTPIGIQRCDLHQHNIQWLHY